MKKIVYSIILLISMSSLTYAQEAANIAKSNGDLELVKSKSSGEFEFTFLTDRTTESVEKAASYYSKYFTVDFDAASNSALVKMVENDVTSRVVVARFLSSNQIRYVEVDGANVSISDFIDTYLK